MMMNSGKVVHCCKEQLLALQISVGIENCFAGADTLQIAATSLHCRKLVVGLQFSENRIIIGLFLLKFF